MRWKAKRTKNIESYLCNLKPKFKSNFCGLFRNNKSASLHSCTILHSTPAQQHIEQHSTTLHSCSILHHYCKARLCSIPTNLERNICSPQLGSTHRPFIERFFWFRPLKFLQRGMKGFWHTHVFGILNDKNAEQFICAFIWSLWLMLTFILDSYPHT